MAEINVNQQTTMSQIQSTFKDTGDGKDLRVNENEDRLHTKSWKPGGFGADAATRREAKYQSAVNMVKDTINREYGDGVGDRVLSKLGITDRMSVGQLKQMSDNYIVQTRAELAQELAQEMTAFIDDLKSSVIQHYNNMDDVDPNQHAMFKEDPIRVTTSVQSAMAKISKDQEVPNDISVMNSCGCLMKGFESDKQLSSSKIDFLINLPCVEQAVGDMTSKKGIEFNYDNEQARDLSMHQGALELKSFIDEALNDEEKQFLKERVEFVREIAGLQIDKIGYCSSPDDSDEKKLQQWIRTDSVNSGIFLGFDMVEQAKESDMKMRDVMFNSRDLLSALAIHCDTIFD
ncbi:hypothetical protein [Motilimonas pumila]|uniref:Uncharacterized protein n=1 Tax=Motilimonas pumila TaxID=2303987 RepID=A0A418YC44_9GAMM|nr:hypothetical protein [Motilimonas pumila]RJG42097.1 hypothetical protein D1Z90_15035 [Motilimonas pumila]